MSEPQDDDDVRVEIQKLLTSINDDMVKLKNELKSVNNLVEENASLPMTVKMVNEKLMIAAKDAGINLEDIGDTANENDLEEDGATGSIDAEQSNDDAVGSMPNAAALSAAADKLTEKMKYALK